MKAFIEITSGIIRSGPEAEKYGDPYEGAAAFSCVDGKTAVIKALTADGLTPAHAKAAFRAVRKLGLEPSWERIKHDDIERRPPTPGDYSGATGVLDRIEDDTYPCHEDSGPGG